MASKRMFSMQILDTDAFLDLPLSAQALYIHLNMRADDDGIVDNVKRVMKIIGANQNDLDILLAKRFILGFQSGVICIKHWFIHNTIRKDRYKKTVYQNELSLLTLKENKSYTETYKNILIENERQPLDNHLTTIWQPSGTTDIDLGLDLDIDLDPPNNINIISPLQDGGHTQKESEKIEIIVTDKNKVPPTLEMVKEYCLEKNFNINVEHFIDHHTARGWILSNGKKMKDWQAAVRTWVRNDKTFNKPKSYGNAKDRLRESNERIKQEIYKMAEERRKKDVR